MNSANIFNEKSAFLQKSLKTNLRFGVMSVLAVGALALSLVGAEAQVIPSPYGIQLGGASVSSYYSNSYNNTFSAYGQNFPGLTGYGYVGFGTGLGGNPYGVQGYVNPYGISSYSALGGMVYPSGNNAIPVPYQSNAIPLQDVSNAVPVAGGVNYMNPYYGGVTVTQGNGTQFLGPKGNYNPYVDLTGSNNPFFEQNYNQTYGRTPYNGASAKRATTQLPTTLAQAMQVQRQRNYGLTFTWRGDPQQITSMNVTLLNKLHLPVARAFGENGEPAVFAPNSNTFAARYYRVDAQYADGTHESTQGNIQPAR